MKSQRYLPLLAALVLMLGALAGGRFSPSHPPAPTRDDWSAHPAIRGFTSALQIIDEHYGVAADRERLTRGAVQGMLRALDPHSGFFDRREFNEMQDEQSSKFYGVGVTINQRNGRIYVLDAGEGLPAERAGLRYGDAIIEVDGKPTRSWTQADALRHVRGERGTAVELTVGSASRARSGCRSCAARSPSHPSAASSCCGRASATSASPAASTKRRARRCARRCGSSRRKG
jgi:carboxyl-terminal processing protease